MMNEQTKKVNKISDNVAFILLCAIGLAIILAAQNSETQETVFHQNSFLGVLLIVGWIAFSYSHVYINNKDV